MQNNINKKDIIFSEDIRGTFKKVYDSDQLFQLNTIKEVFISKSIKNTLRGMHYQTEPYALNKIVICLEGKILDVIVNIDKKDKRFGEVSYIELIENESIFVPSNFAHGFYCIEHSTVMYLTDNYYSKETENGILWNSIDFDWPKINFIISERDKSFNKLSNL